MAMADRDAGPAAEPATLRPALPAPEPIAPEAVGGVPAAGGDPPKAAAAGLIVDDGADAIEPHQLKRGAFVGQLRSAVGAAAENALAGVFWAALARPKVTEEL